MEALLMWKKPINFFKLFVLTIKLQLIDNKAPHHQLFQGRGEGTNSRRRMIYGTKICFYFGLIVFSVKFKKIGDILTWFGI